MEVIFTNLFSQPPSKKIDQNCDIGSSVLGRARSLKKPWFDIRRGQHLYHYSKTSSSALQPIKFPTQCVSWRLQMIKEREA